MYSHKLFHNLKNDLQKIFESPISEPAILHLPTTKHITVSTNIIPSSEITELAITELRSKIQSATESKSGPKPTLSKLYPISLNIGGKIITKYQIHFNYTPEDIKNFQNV